MNQEVVNPARTEWGIGKVLSVEPGPAGRGVRVRVSFPGAGVKTMMVPPGTLVPPDARPPAGEGTDESEDVDRLQNLPAVITDPKADLETRLVEIIKFYRFGDDARGIFDWAVMRTGKSDPLDEFTADELKGFYGVFCHRRDLALRELHRQARKVGREAEFQAILQRRTSDIVRKRMLEVLADRP